MNPTVAELNAARDTGLAELDRAEGEILGALPRADATPEAERLRRAAALRIEFATKHHVNTKGRKLDFTDTWLLPIYRDEHSNKVIVKCVQVGISEWAVVYSLSDSASGRIVFYVLPTFDIRNRFVAQRVDRPLLLVPEYRRRQFESIGDTDNKGLKAFGAGAMYFVSADTPRSFIEAAADTLIIDERDQCNPENLALAPDRLEHAEHPVSINIGNPTHPNFGISKEYEGSDQRVWMVKCARCGEWQEVDFFSNVLRVTRDEDGEIVAFDLLDSRWRAESDRDIRCYCRKCERPLDRLEADPKRAGWIAREPGKPVAGYRVSHLMSARKSVRSIYAAWCLAQGDPTKSARVINNVLGLSYSPAGSSVTDAILDHCRKDFSLVQNAEGPCTMGVDVGKLWDVRISDCPEPGVRRARLIGRFAAMEPVMDLIERFHVDCCVMDAKPEIELARRFQKAVQEKFARGSGRWLVWRCDFHRGENLREPKRDEAEGIVQVDRTAIFDQAMADLRRKLNWLPKDAAHLLGGDYYAQMKEPKRQLVETPSGEQRYIWTKGVDHQRLADVYDKLAGLVRPAPILTDFIVAGT